MLVGFCSETIFFKKKKGCIVTGNKQDKCLQMVEVHMQFRFGQNIVIPSNKQLQNPLFFYPSLLMMVESSLQNLAW